MVEYGFLNIFFCFYLQIVILDETSQGETPEPVATPTFIPPPSTIPTPVPAPSLSNSNVINPPPSQPINSGLVPKPKSLTKLPMPPGIKLTEIQDIVDSPPAMSRTPSPQARKPSVITPAAVPVKRGIKDLPLPPGE